MIFHRKRQRLFAKAETTPGTYEGDATLFSALLGKLPIYDLRMVPTAQEYTRKPDGLTLDGLDSIMYGEYVTVTFKSELFTGGAAGTAPDYAALLKSCGMTETIVASTSVAYKVSSNEVPTLSLGGEFIGADGSVTLRFGVAGAIGSFQLTADVPGKPGVFSWTFIGKLAYVSTTPQFISSTVLAAVSYSDSVSNICKFLGTDVTIGGVSRSVSSITVDRGLTSEFETLHTDQTSFLKRILADSEPTFTLNPTKVPVATQNDISGLVAGTNVALAAQFGTVAGKRCIAAAPRAQRKTVGDGAVGVTSTWDLVFGCRRSSPTGNGDDAFTLTYT